MGLLVPPPRVGLSEANYSGRPTTTWGTTITGSATAHTLGTRSEIVASTARLYNRIRVSVQNTGVSATSTDTLLNIYLGGSGAESVLIPNLLAGWRAPAASIDAPQSWTFPLYIPRGSRISADAQSVVTSKAVYVQIDLWWEDGWAGCEVETLGAVTGSSRGTTITPGTTSEGSWTSIGTTSRRWRMAMLDIMGNVDTTLTAGRMAGDIGTGSALIAGLENFDFTANATEYWMRASELPRTCDIPASTALQARLQSHTTDTETKSVVIHGVY